MTDADKRLTRNILIGVGIGAVLFALDYGVRWLIRYMGHGGALLFLFVAMLTPEASIAAGDRCSGQVATVYIAGDSITRSYWYSFESAAPLSWAIGSAATNGIRAEEFNGDVGDLDHTQDVIDGGAEYVVVLLGTTNAAKEWTLPPRVSFDRFTAAMESALDRWAAAGVVAIVGIPTPRLPTSERNVIAEARLAILYRPWLIAKAAWRGLDTVDFYDLFVTLPDWGDGLAYFPDGVHPDTAARDLMGDLAVSSACSASAPQVPGLSSLFLLVLAGCLAWCGRRALRSS